MIIQKIRISRRFSRFVVAWGAHVLLPFETCSYVDLVLAHMTISAPWKKHYAMYIRATSLLLNASKGETFFVRGILTNSEIFAIHDVVCDVARLIAY